VSRPIKDTAVSHRSRVLAITALVLSGLAVFESGPANAQQVSREQDIGTLRLGQRIKVDDGTCPAGRGHLGAGDFLDLAGVVRSAKCVPRLGAKTSPNKQYSQ
jgi:hypothetical protein